MLGILRASAAPIVAPRCAQRRPLTVLRSVEEVRAWNASRKPGATGFVPTMGALHSGHLALMSRAALENGAVVASIFVNPKQFAPTEDFGSYPRPLEADLAKLRSVNVDAVFLPTPELMYPAAFRTYVAPEGVDALSEGAARPGFFRGVATVVCKLFNIVQPTRAYFGQKDGLQCIVIRRMVQDLNMPLAVTICPTVREADGLAMSSRNVYLSPEQRSAAPDVYAALQLAEAARVQTPAISVQELRDLVGRRLAQQPLFAPQYVSVADGDTGEELAADRALSSAARVMVAVAVKVGHTRLIDNVLLE